MNTAIKIDQPIYYQTELRSVTNKKKKTIALWKIKQKAIGLLLIVMGTAALVVPAFELQTLSLLIIPGVALQFVKSNFFEF